MRKRKSTTDAIEIMHRRFFEGKPEMMALLEEERANADVAQSIYDLRQEAGLTQQELADLIGTKQAVIARLEDADYEGHSLSMLNRIASALNRKVRIEFDPVAPKTDVELQPDL
jgi:ribosome-binding protein aMBF1 (putative translation factor)